MKKSLKGILRCPKCKNLYGLISDSWTLDKDILPGQDFFCAECLSYGRLQDDHTIKLTQEGRGTINRYGKEDDGELEDIHFPDFGFE